MEDHDAVEAKIVDENEASVGGGDGRVGVWGVLAALDWAGAGELEVGDGFREGAIGVGQEGGDTASAIVWLRGRCGRRGRRKHG